MTVRLHKYGCVRTDLIADPRKKMTETGVRML
jgi:hypothetical protein